MKKEMFYTIIRSPILTEKSSQGAEQNKISFRVSQDANKGQIKEAVEFLFNVKVTAVNTLNVKGKVKRFRGRIGKRVDVKKAIVSLAEGQSIDIAAGA